jgi:hypothetical protein
MKQFGAYDVLQEEEIPELKAVGTIYRHRKTKARVVVISNEDTNKVFTIGFRTPPQDDTGVPHIMEHSVLCGSAKYPAKDPFVELAKGSLNTFLNAMTYSDKTVYPIASYNDKDFQNLMDVYLDAVFHPNIYIHEEILKQEGWHYELDSKDGELTYNGVVYNEMKGVYSDPDQQLARLIQMSLLPGTTYAYESGGEPGAIPKLTYKQFLDFHKKYYHPSNSYIYLYGDMNVKEKLDYIDREYLSKYDYQKVDSQIRMAIDYAGPKTVTYSYSLAESEELQDNTFLSYNVIIGTSLDPELYMAMQLLQSVLLDVPGAPLKEALIHAGIGKDIESSYDSSIQQPVFSIIARNANAEDMNRFIETIDKTLKDICEHGIPKKSMQAAINHLEFQLRESDFGRYPKGLIYGLRSFDSWLHDEKAPFIHIKVEETLGFMKRGLENGYFERTIAAYLLHNTHKSYVILKPEYGLNEKQEAAVKQELADYKASLTDAQVEQIIQSTKALKAYQAEPSSEEDLKKIPLLEIQDIEPKIQKQENVVRDLMGIPTVVHPIFTNGIAYLHLCFKLDKMPLEHLPYVNLLASVLGMVNTEHYTYHELASEIRLKSGSIYTQFEVRGTLDPDAYLPTFDLKAKMLYEQVDDTFHLIEEILLHSRLDDTGRLKEVIAELKAGMKPDLSSRGHSTAANRAMSYVSKGSYVKEKAKGIDYYEFIDDLDQNFEDRKQNLVVKLKQVLEELLHKENLILSYTGDNDVEEAIGMNVALFSVWLSTRKQETPDINIELKAENEAFKTASQVQYVATAGNYKKQGFQTTGALRVLETIFAYEYLWLNVRVQGGAYGCMCGFGDNGTSYLTSYRDPNLMETYEVYKNAAEFVANFQADDRDMTKYIIGAIGTADIPLNAYDRGERDFNYYLTGITDEYRQQIRDELLATNQATIRGLSQLVKSVSDNGVICAIGNEKRIEREAEHFKEVRSVF